MNRKTSERTETGCDFAQPEKDCAAVGARAACFLFGAFSLVVLAASISGCDGKDGDRVSANVQDVAEKVAEDDSAEAETETAKEEESAKEAPKNRGGSGIRARRDKFPVSTSKDIVPGVWNANLAEGIAYANAHHRPMLVVQGTAFCHSCKRLREAVRKSEFEKWASERGLVLIYGERVRGFNDLMRPGKLKKSPKVAVYWNRGDGIATTNYFSGITEYMPVARKKDESLGRQFIASIESFIGPKSTEKKKPADGKGR